MATTRAATFSAKIRTLSEFHTRIVSNQQPPSNAEIITTLRYFHQTLVGFLKEIPSENAHLFVQFDPDHSATRSTLFPTLNYHGLFSGIVNLLDSFPSLTSGQTAIGDAILDTLRALYFFLDRDCIDQYPFLISSQLGVLPAELDEKAVRILAECIIPYALGEHTSGAWELSIPAVLMFIFQQCADSSLHSLIVESLMARKTDVYADLLEVIAKCTREARVAATNLLFHYWPLLEPAILHRKPIKYRVQAWSTPPCQNLSCAEKGPALKYNYDPVACAKHGETSPPMLLCKACAENIGESLSERSVKIGSMEASPLHRTSLCQPMPSSVGVLCQNRGCGSANRLMFGTCFAEDCIRAHAHVPLRLCSECFGALHSRPETASHLRHSKPGVVWGAECDARFRTDMVEAVVKLLKETTGVLHSDGGEVEVRRPKWLRQLEAGVELGRDIDPMSDERRMLSRYGLWLMAAMCPPDERVAAAGERSASESSSLGYVISMLFQWFSTTALLPNDSMGAAIEQLKTDVAAVWLQTALTHHYELVVSLLAPDLPDYAKVGGIWEKLPSRRDQLRDGLQKLLALIPYDVISLNTWNRVMPLWLHSISQEVPDEEDLADLKVLLCKIFEPDLCPLSFGQEQMFEFITTRINSGLYEETISALDWLHLLSRIDIRVPLGMLLTTFTTGLAKLRAVKSRIHDSRAEEDKQGDERTNRTFIAVNELELASGPLAVEVIMADVIAQQLKLHDTPPNGGSPLAEQLFMAAASLLQYDAQRGEHSCGSSERDEFADCLPCQQAVFLYQVLVNLIRQMSPREEARIDADLSTDLSEWLANTDMTATSAMLTPESQSHPSNLPSLSSPKEMTPSGGSSSGVGMIGGGGGKRNSLLQFLQASQHETRSPGEEFVGVLPSEEVEQQTAVQTTSLTESELGHEACQVVTATLCADSAEQVGGTNATAESTAVEALKVKDMRGEKAEESKMKKEEGGDAERPPEFWDTSVGRFRFTLGQLPPQMRLVYALLMNIGKESDPDVQYFLLCSLKYMCLHCEALSGAKREHRGFVIWAQENCMVPKLWTLLRSEFSQVGQMATHLLLHAITLPCGEDVFWNTVNAQFTSEKWELRFKGVERVYVLAHMLIDPIVAKGKEDPVRGNRLLQTTLSCAFSHLIASVIDPNTAVAQRAMMALKSIPSASLAVSQLALISQCLEAQFDSCILDRPLIINRMRLLTTVVPEESLLTWDFFIQRFETLALEAQLKRYANDTSCFVQDLLRSDPMSELYQRKLTKARQSLNEAESVRSIVRSLRDNSLKHQLAIAAKIDKEQRSLAQGALNIRGRRGATHGADLTRLRLRRVLMMVRVVGAFRTITSRLPQLTSLNPFRSSASSSRTQSPTASPQLHTAVTPATVRIASLIPDEVVAVHEEGESEEEGLGGEIPPSTPPETDAATMDNVGYEGQKTLDVGEQYGPDTLRSPIEPLARNGGRNGGGSYRRLKEFADEESNLCLLLNRIVDIENPERHTVYLTVSLFVHFLSNKRSGASDEKATAKKQSMLLRHFNTLLGYSNSERCFTIPPNRLRQSAVCNAFLNGLAEILDNNLMMGNQMLPIVLQLLLHLPSTQKFASDTPSADYSLALMGQFPRHAWLHSLILILYKYRCDSPASTVDGIRKLLMIIVATLEAECHTCRDAQNATDENGNVGGEVGGGNVDNNIEWVEWTDSSDSEADGEGGNKEKTAIDEKAGKYSEQAGKMQRPANLGHATGPESASRPTRISLTRPHRYAYSNSAEGPPPSASNEGRESRSGRRMITERPATSSRQLRTTACPLRCVWCDERLEHFDEETISLCFIGMATYLQREPAVAAPLLPRMIFAVATFIDRAQFQWWHAPALTPLTPGQRQQAQTSPLLSAAPIPFVPGNSKSAAKQFLRVVIHQLSGSGVAFQLFDSPVEPAVLDSFWASIAFALTDCAELSAVQLIQCLFDDLVGEWPQQGVKRVLYNLAAYIRHVPLVEPVALGGGVPGGSGSAWANVVASMDAFFRRYDAHSQLQAAPASSNQAAAHGGGISVTTNLTQLQSASQQAPSSQGARQMGSSELSSSVVIMCQIMHAPNFPTLRSAISLVESYAKWLVDVLHWHRVDLISLMEVCSACNKMMPKERDKLIITRAIVNELIQAVKFKCELLEDNYLAIVNLILQDFGESPIAGENGDGSENDAEGLFIGRESAFDRFNTGAAEAVRPFMSDVLEFIADLHVLAKLKKQTSSDRMGGDLKALLSEVLALEMSRPSLRDSRTVMRFIPWLYSPPSLVAQAAPGSFAESVTNVRILAWLLLGALHATRVHCLPIPVNCSIHIADHITFVLAGFAEQSKQSVVHMSALFHAFHLCQLWTVYCEQAAQRCRDIPGSVSSDKIMEEVLEFWVQVTPAILQLLSHSRVLADMVNLHFVNTMQALKQCGSVTLSLLYPMWQPILTAHHAVVPSQLRMKLDECENQPSIQHQPLGTWLKKVRYKISQIELQTSAASPFYNV